MESTLCEGKILWPLECIDRDGGYMDRKQTGYLLLGITIGAAAAMLMAPQTGREAIGAIRRRVSKGADLVNEGIDSAAGTVKGAMDTVKSGVQRGRQALKYQKENLQAAVEAGKQAFREGVESTPTV